MPIDTLENLDDVCFEKFTKLIHSLTGITIAVNRKSMVQARLRKRMLALSLKSYEDYYDFLKANNEETVSFIDSVTTNETYFFRTPRIWSYIETQLLPNYLLKNPGKTFSAWSAASSTGEEAHSLGVLCQHFKDKNAQFNYEIMGSDISQRVVSVCKEGMYQGRSVEAFKNSMPHMFTKYMVKKEGTPFFSVQPEIKQKIKFFEHNLFTPPKEKKFFDLILIRNVFIYFTQADQKKVLDLILPKLTANGILIIGESETLTGVSDGLEKVENLIYKKMLDKQMVQKVLNVHIGEIKIAKNGEVLKAILGSCVGIGFIWKKKNVCALAHCLLPENPEKSFAISGRYVDQAINSMIALMKIDDHEFSEIEVVFVGGGNMTNPNAADNSKLVGGQNLIVAERELKKKGLKVVFSEHGGYQGRKISIDSLTCSYRVDVIPRLNLKENDNDRSK